MTCFMCVISFDPYADKEPGAEQQSQDSSPDLQYLELKFKFKTVLGNVLNGKE